MYVPDLVDLLLSGKEGKVADVQGGRLSESLLKLLLCAWKSPVSVVGESRVQKLQTETLIRRKLEEANRLLKVGIVTRLHVQFYDCRKF